MSIKIYGIALAAGFGSRLNPLTGFIPKPMLPAGGEPMLSLTLRRLIGAGAERIAVNTHHLGSQISRWVADSPFRDRVTLYPESEILGTGGPFVNARSLLEKADVILLHNTDVVCNFDLKKLIAQHVAGHHIATMALIDGPENCVMTSGGKVRDIQGKLNVTPGPEESCAMLTYACVMALSPEIFRFLPQKPEFCSIIPAILEAVRQIPDSVGAFFPDEPYFWSDIGTFEQYFHTQSEILLNGAMSPILPAAPDGVRYGKNVRVGHNVRFFGFVSLGDGCVVGDDAQISNCVLLPGASVCSGDSRAWEVIAGDFSCHRLTPRLAQLKFLPCPLREMTVSSLAEQGSSRTFLRLRPHVAPDDSQVLMLSSAADPDFFRFLDIGKFFFRKGLFTPRLIASDAAEYAVLMEDLGDDTVFRLANGCADSPSMLEELYRQVIRTLAEFQVRGTAELEMENFDIRDFDYDYLRWETSYFAERFLRNLCGIDVAQAKLDALNAEFHTLAELNLAMPQTLMHRDFQSQNILIRHGLVRFVDFQGARLGPCTYDIMSLLKDPYLPIPADMRERLAGFHRDELTVLGMELSPEAYRRNCVLASLQRSMQCLGAYGFLSLVKGKYHYLAFAGPCLESLAGTIREAESMNLKFPVLSACVEQAAAVLPERIQIYSSR